MRGCGPGCHCVRRMDNMREEALQGLVSDSIEKFMPCDILKDEFDALKKELTELREKAVGENAIATLAANANEKLSDVPALSEQASAQSQRFSTDHPAFICTARASAIINPTLCRVSS